MKELDTDEGAGGATLEPHGGASRSASPAGRSGMDEAVPKERLADADRHLLAIGAEVAALREELARLRAEAGERAELLAERELVIAELTGLLPTLEDARVQAEREAEDASSALFRTEARLSEQAARATVLQAQLATVEEANATREGLVADLEARVAEERTKREGSDRARAEASAHTQAAERSLVQVRRQLEDLAFENERLLAERENERAEARRLLEDREAAIRLSEARLIEEKTRIETLEHERENFEAALDRHLAGLAQLEAAVSHVRGEHEEIRAAVAADHRYDIAGSSRLEHPRFVFWVGGVLDATSAAVDALLSRSAPDVDRTGANTVGHTLGHEASGTRPQAAVREAGRWLTDVFRHANERSRGRALRSPGRHPRGALSSPPRPAPELRGRDRAS
jgi:hypothetical protein